MYKLHPVPIEAAHCPDQTLVNHAKLAWDKALALVERFATEEAINGQGLAVRYQESLRLVPAEKE